MAVEIIQLKEVSKSILDDVNGLLAQLRGDESKNHGTVAELNEVVGNKGVAIIVAKDGKRIVGMGFLYLMVHIGRRTGHIEDVVVDEAFRGQGLGEKIVQKLIAAARENNLGTIYLTSRPSRVAANKLYQKLGFMEKETNVYKLPL